MTEIPIGVGFLPSRHSREPMLATASIDRFEPSAVAGCQRGHSSTRCVIK